MRGIDRRNFLRTTLGGLGGLGLASCMDSPITPRSRIEEMVMADLDANGIFLRQDIYCLNEASEDLKAYRAAVAVMKSRLPTNPTSWEAQRAIHWTVARLPGMIFNQCQHQTRFFLSWHRMYIYWFERIARAASGVPTFALPYWGYSPTGRRDLPEPFRWPPSPVTNPLFVPERDPSVNTGEPLRASAVDSGAAMPHTSFWSFQTALEGTPHGMVHVGVGGYMRLVETSALDPIFYLHHANIDRLWEVWLALGGGRENPPDSDWRNQKFNFYDENGKTVSMKGDEIVRTAEQLAYRYIECSGVLLDASEPTLVAQLQGDAALLAARIGRRPPLTEVQTLTALRTGSKLGARPAAMQVPLPPEAADALRRFEEGTVGNDVVVHLQGIVLLEDPKVYYEVYANLSSAAGDTAYTSPHFVGNLDFFGIPKEDDTDHTMHGGNNRRLSLLRVYAFLRTHGLWSDQALTLTFIPRGYTEDVTPTAVLTTDQVYIDQVSVELR